MKKALRTILKAGTLGGIGCLAALLVCNHLVSANAKGRVFTEIDSLPESDVALLLGTSPRTRIGNRVNQFFAYRIDAAERIYKAGKVKTILISGAENNKEGENEVVCMRDSLVARGVDAHCLMLDGKGLRTLDSVVRAAKVYGLSSFVVVSQRFHNERAIYLADHLGLNTELVTGYCAEDATSSTAFLTYIREYFARVKMFIDILSS